MGFHPRWAVVSAAQSTWRWLAEQGSTQLYVATPDLMRMADADDGDAHTGSEQKGRSTGGRCKRRGARQDAVQGLPSETIQGRLWRNCGALTAREARCALDDGNGAAIAGFAERVGSVARPGRVPAHRA